DGGLLLAASDGSVYRWHTATGKPAGGPLAVKGLSQLRGIARGGGVAAGSDGEGQLGVVDVRTGKRLGHVPREGGRPQVALSAGGEVLAWDDGDDHFRGESALWVWGPSSGRPAVPL